MRALVCLQFIRPLDKDTGIRASRKQKPAADQQDRSDFQAVPIASKRCTCEMLLSPLKRMTAGATPRIVLCHIPGISPITFTSWSQWNTALVLSLAFCVMWLSALERVLRISRFYSRLATKGTPVLGNRLPTSQLSHWQSSGWDSILEAH